ncbi:MAG: tRNA (guanosine(37)-N1)-methyltransferase TrmD [Capsulimonas sp.]|uniref:tRNA (guanosine(37)-N1)-methyltransferase TrmD n=1 Tax=Capsulimonas sp. TaxID=2494211 RepID=UPI00326461D5
MKIDVITIFPEMIRSGLSHSIIKRAQEAGRVELAAHDPRDHTTDRHRSTDDTPYGGGAGMVMRPGPIFAAVESLEPPSDARIVMLTPQGKTLTQAMAHEFAQSSHLILLCGHYEGFDERVREHLATDEISIGDYVLTGGELPALVLIDAVVRLLPGVLGSEESAAGDTFSDGLLEYPQYTRPPDFRGWTIPEVLLSGNHAAIANWRRKEQFRRTQARRPDLWSAFQPSKSDLKLIKQLSEEIPSPSAGESSEEN